LSIIYKCHHLLLNHYPFAYLQRVIDKVKGELSSEGSQKTKNGRSAVIGQNCSDCTALGGPVEISIEQFTSSSPLTQFLREISYPQNAKLSRLAEQT
jgi:hypothetical protein